MHRLSIILLIFLCLATSRIRCSGDHKGQTEEGKSTKYPRRPVQKNIEELKGLPEDTEIVHEDALDYIQEDSRKHLMMGVSDEKCDNASYGLEVDFDPLNVTLLDLNSKCHETEYYPVDEEIPPRLTLLKVPKRYTPIHRCMNHRIIYKGRIPLIGPHRPLWATYGEYTYLPPQRWLHNVEHGAIIILYHPCADPDELEQLKELVKSCLFRHVVTPFANLTRERPIALVGWSASLEFARFDRDMTKGFARFFAKTGPERMFRNGQYRHLLTDPAEIITNVIDSEVCPEGPR